MSLLQYDLFQMCIRDRKYIQRGKVDLFINYEDYTEGNLCLKYNKALAGEYMDYFKKMEEEFGIRNDIQVSTLSRCPEVLTMEPVSYTHLHIRAIQSAAFKNSGLTGTVEFSDDLFQIGSDAFIGCVDLTEVKFSNPASDLGDADPGLSVDPYAFARTGPTEIEFPADLRSVGSSAFEDTDMQSITFTGENVPLLTYP